MTTTRRLILAVDCGSTNLKSAVFTAALERLQEASVPVSYGLRDERCAEMPAEAVWEAFLDLTMNVCREAGLSTRDITDIALGSQAQTFTLCSANGSPLMPFLSWMDRRAEAEAEEVSAAMGPGFHRQCSFAPPIAQLQLCKMRWARQHLPAAVAAPNVLALLPGFIAWRLGVPNTADRNLAAMGGAYSLALGTWWPQALEFCGMAADRMPRLVDVGTTVSASVEPATGLFRPGIAVTFAGNDQTAGAYGNDCERGGMVVTLGTALVVYRHTGARPGPYSPGGCWGPYPGGSYYELGTIDQGCQALDWARNGLMPAASPAAFDAAARCVIASQRQADAPLFFPQHVPHGNPWRSPSSDQNAMAYAVLEGISFALRRLIDVTLQAAGMAREIVAIGGGSHSDVWLSLMADALGTPVSRGTGDALLGAAAMALGQRQAQPKAPGIRFLPDAERRSVLADRYRRWQAEL